MQQTALEPHRLVRWSCVAGHPNWQHNTFSFTLEERNGETALQFVQQYAQELSDETYGTFNFNWGYYLPLEVVLRDRDGHAVRGDLPGLERPGRLCCNFRAATSGWTTFGKHRTGSPIMPSDNPFKWRQFEPALILQCVRWYLR